MLYQCVRMKKETLQELIALADTKSDRIDEVFLSSQHARLRKRIEKFADIMGQAFPEGVPLDTINPEYARLPSWMKELLVTELQRGEGNHLAILTNQRVKNDVHVAVVNANNGYENSIYVSSVGGILKVDVGVVYKDMAPAGIENVVGGLRTDFWSGVDIDRRLDYVRTARTIFEFALDATRAQLASTGLPTSG